MPDASQLELLSGNRMTALGALDAGCRFFSGYPITPSSEIYQTMMEELPAQGGVALAAPDEITALAYCVGASLAGYKAMTATSGPGWGLMVETVQYAVMTETPAVIAVVQRLGPSTGGATQGAQGDVLCTQYFTSGSYTVPVLAPSNSHECYELTQAAFYWSERLRTPVIVLSDKEVGMTSESVNSDSLRRWPVVERKPFSKSAKFFRTYACDCLEEPPAFSAVGGRARVAATGSAHDQEGRLRKNSPEVLELLIHLQTKIDAHADEISLIDEEPCENADLLILSYGISVRAARAAVRQLRAQGRRVSFLQIKSLFPVPKKEVVRAAAGCKRVYVVEENLTGQYASVLEPIVGSERLVRVNGIGHMITPGEILEPVDAT
ncbi:MAG: pyruvate flavodoxin/ferredoxin oxidoreductase [Acidobacteria bacterium]|nr:pyruvate flavodoxin/ferredoxin oxidoreductase [Acidobacteriota bacterium]